LDAVEKPVYASKRRKRFTLDERKQFIESVKGDRLDRLFLLAITKGLREGELLGLRWCDVDLEIKFSSFVNRFSVFLENVL
jgi:integrase